MCTRCGQQYCNESARTLTMVTCYDDDHGNEERFAASSPTIQSMASEAVADKQAMALVRPQE